MPATRQTQLSTSIFQLHAMPRAITALRYFYEKKPELHVIGAGSLLEFAFKSDKFRMPVGRISSIFMEPLSFGEFLEAVGKGNLNKEQRGNKLTKITLSFRLDSVGLIEQNRRRSRATLRIL